MVIDGLSNKKIYKNNGSRAKTWPKHIWLSQATQGHKQNECLRFFMICFTKSIETIPGFSSEYKCSLGV
jgi:hypothetical protein